MRRNPYFIGILSAMCEVIIISHNFRISRNPYFIGILSAIRMRLAEKAQRESRNPYFIGILSAINSNILYHYTNI